MKVIFATTSRLTGFFLALAAYAALCGTCLAAGASPAEGAPSALATNTPPSLENVIAALKTANPDLDTSPSELRKWFGASGNSFNAPYAKKTLKDIAPLRGLALKSVYLCNTSVTDFSVLSGMPLTGFLSSYTHFNGKNLDFLKGAPLTVVSVHNAEVEDIKGLQGCPLETLNLTACCHEFADLAPLKGAPLKNLSINDTSVTDLRPLEGCPLVTLTLDGCPIADLSPLAKTALVELSIVRCKNLTDLSPLKGLSLKRLYLQGSGVTDLTPIADAPLEYLTFTPAKITKGLDEIRRIKTLKGVDVKAKIPGEFLLPDEFWKRYDAGEFSKL